MYSLLPTLGAVLAGVAAGLCHGRHLATRGFTSDTAFSGYRGIILLLLFCGLLAVLGAGTRLADTQSPEVATALQAAGWASVQALLAFIGTVALPLGHPARRMETLLIVALTLAAIALAQWAKAWVFAPVYSRIVAERRGPRGEIMQTLPTTCTAASVANILRSFGKPATEYESAKALGTTRFGTTMGQLQAGLPAALPVMLLHRGKLGTVK